MANIREIARLSGVSVGTVSRYLNGIKVREENAQAIARVIREHNYKPSILGRALARNGSFTIGVLMADASNVFVGSSIGRLETALERMGYSALFIDFHDDVDVLRQKMDFLKSRLVEAIVIFLSEVEDERLENLADYDIPVIVVDNPIEGDNIDSIVVNNAESSQSLVSSMLDAGHRRVGIIAPSQQTYVGRERLKGCREAFAHKGIEMHEEDIVLSDSSKQGGYKAALQLLDTDAVDAVFACNYYMALGAIKAMNERGVHPGVDMAFASFDDYDFSDVMYPPLSVVRQPMDKIVDLVVETLMGRLRGVECERGLHVVPCDVVVTDSVKLPKR